MRVLFCSSGSPGHLFPAVRLALQLIARGHEVAFLTDTCGDQILTKLGLAQLRDGSDAGLDIKEWFHTSSVVTQTKQLVRACKLFMPALVVGTTFTLGVQLLRYMTGCRVVNIGLATYLFPRPSRGSSPLTLDAQKRSKWRSEQFKGFLDNALISIGLPASPSTFEDVLLNQPYCLRSVPDFEGSELALPTNVHYIGDCLWEEDSVMEERFVAWLLRMREARRTIIYVQHGRTFLDPSFWTALLECAVDKKLALIASTNKMDFDPGALPSYVYASSHTPQAYMLQISSALICSGTSTPVLGAIRARKPIILIPAGGEQFDIADRCCSLDIGRSIAAVDLVQRNLSRLFDEVLGNDVMRYNLSVLAASFEAFEREEKGVALLLKSAEKS